MELGAMARVTKGLAQGGSAKPIGRIQILSNVLGVWGGATWQGNALPLCHISTSPGGTEGMQPIPCQWKVPQHSHPNPKQRPTSMRAARWTGPRETMPVIPFLNPDPVACLVGQSKWGPCNCRWAKGYCIDQLRCPGFQYQLWVLWPFSPRGPPSGQTVAAGRQGGSAIPYLGYVEVNLQIPGIKVYNEGVKLTMIYSEKVLVMVGSKIIHWVLGMMTMGELETAT